MNRAKLAIRMRALFRRTQREMRAKGITEDDIFREIAAYRAEEKAKLSRKGRSKQVLCGRPTPSEARGGVSEANKKPHRECGSSRRAAILKRLLVAPAARPGPLGRATL